MIAVTLQKIISRWRSERSKRAKRECQKYFWRRRGCLSIETLYHILRVFLIDREGRIRNIYSSGTLDPRLVLADVKTLLLEEAKRSKQ